MSSKNYIWAILADFSPCRYEVHETRQIPTENFKTNSFLGQISFGIQLWTYPWHCNTKKDEPITWPQYEKTHCNKRCQYNEVKKSPILYPSFMSEQHMSTSSRICMLLKNFKFFRHAQGHQQSDASTDYKNMIKNITVNRVEHEDSDKIKNTWKINYLFSRKIRRVLSLLFGWKVDSKTHKHRKKSCIALVKLNTRCNKFFWLKSTVGLKERTRIPLILSIEKILMLSKTTIIWAIVADMILCRYKTNNDFPALKTLLLRNCAKFYNRATKQLLVAMKLK